VAVLRILQERGFRPDYVAGHSLGEYSALVCAGCISFQDAVRTVRKRGKYMQEAVPVDRGAMAAVLGLDADSVSAACTAASSSGIVAPANFNAPDQTVIAGEASAVLRASEIARSKGAKRIVQLSVSAPFHCDLMAPARDRLAADLKELEFHDLKMPLINNVDAAAVVAGNVARDSLIRQVCNPVRWVESIQYLVGRGVDTFVEIGPGKVLCGLVKKIAPQVQTCSIDGIRGIEALASVILGAKM
jgi:[acyl-carrier-protein] S-malonyltransferase